MKNEDYPGLFLAADCASLTAQRVYVRLQVAYLSSLVLGSVIGEVNLLVSDKQGSYLHLAIAFIYVFGILILLLTRARRDDQIWFDCRAIAESVKTVTWRYMMNVPPFQRISTDDEQFIKVLQEIRKARSGSEKALASYINADAPPITDFMRQVRSSPFVKRKKIYISSRLCEQKSWYSKKANINARSGAKWFWIIGSLQAFVVAIAMTQTAIGSFKFDLVSVITTCVAVIIAWSHMKRHDELAKAYSLAAQELGELEVIAKGLSHESEFSQLVEQVEETISREHTLWCARRDVPLEGHVSGNIM